MDQQHGGGTKAYNKLRICLDPRDLNKALKRPEYPMPTIEGILAELAGAKVFFCLRRKRWFLASQARR